MKTQMRDQNDQSRRKGISSSMATKISSKRGEKWGKTCTCSFVQFWLICQVLNFGPYLHGLVLVPVKPGSVEQVIRLMTGDTKVSNRASDVDLAKKRGLYSRCHSFRADLVATFRNDVLLIGSLSPTRSGLVALIEVYDLRVGIRHLARLSLDLIRFSLEARKAKEQMLASHFDD
jgi:hypothetical protein